MEPRRLVSLASFWSDNVLVPGGGPVGGGEEVLSPTLGRALCLVCRFRARPCCEDRVRARPGEAGRAKGRRHCPCGGRKPLETKIGAGGYFPTPPSDALFCF